MALDPMSADPTSAEAYAACAHGSDDMDSCFGCAATVGIGPNVGKPRPPRQVRYGPRFVQRIRAISGDGRWPLRAIKGDNR